MIAMKVEKKTDKNIRKDKEPYGQVRIEYTDERRLATGACSEIYYQGIIRFGSRRISVIEHSCP
jgi:hypothetical protein